MNRFAVIIFVCVGLAACSTTSMNTTKLPDGKVIASVHSQSEQLTISSATIATYECTKRKGCQNIANGGGVTNGAVPLLGAAINAGAILAAPTGGVNIANSVAVKAKAGSGNSTVKITNKNTNVNDNDAKALNINK